MIRPHESSSINSRGGSRAWRRMVAQVVREEPLCRLRLYGCTIRSTTADHIIPKKYRPDLAMVRANLRGSCVNCNLKRGTKTPRQMAAMRQSQKPARALAFFQRKGNI